MSSKFKSTWEKITHWELWPFSAFYFPLGFVWLWYCIRSRSLWFFTPSNPTLTFGGFEGEGKREMYGQLPSDSYPKTIYCHPSEAFEGVLKKMADAGFDYPFIVKPDVGMKGFLFRKIDQEAQLRDYHSQIPEVAYLVQELVDLPMELSVFYVRHPTTQQGQITGMTYKELMVVVGDGCSALPELIRQHPRARQRFEEMTERHGHRFDWVLPVGEHFVLSYAANRNRGARLHNLQQEIDDALTAFFDRLSHHNGTFFYGRYDIKCNSLEDLRQGRNYSILEFNGSGAAPNHVYHCGLSIWQAYREIMRHWHILFEISRHNHQNGSPYWPFWRGLRFLKSAKRHFRILKKYDKVLP